MQKVSAQQGPANQRHSVRHPGISAGIPGLAQDEAVCHQPALAAASRGQSVHQGGAVYPVTGRMCLGHSVVCHTFQGQLIPVKKMFYISNHFAKSGNQVNIIFSPLNLLHSERPKLHTILAFLSVVGLICWR